jgi:glutaminyl-peptide cyclotransferase
LVAALAFAIAGCGGSDDSGSSQGSVVAQRFDADRAFGLIGLQVELGPRPAGSPASRELAEELRGALPDGAFERVPGGLTNVVGTLPGSDPAIVIGAHYDTEATIPGHVGANDGAAGTAAVVELAGALERELPAEHREVRFVLFDGEEEPVGCSGAQLASCGQRGSRAYVAAHPGEVGEMILLDYIANAGLRIPQETNSDSALWKRLRSAAAEVGADSYFPAGAAETWVIDDHIPFLLTGVPSIDLIDFEYKYADTAEDTPDKLDPQALDAVGETVAALVLQLAAPTSP